MRLLPVRGHQGRSMPSRSRSGLRRAFFALLGPIALSVLADCLPREAAAQIVPARGGKICVSDLQYHPLDPHPVLVQLSWDNEYVNPNPPTTNPDTDSSAPTSVYGGTYYTALHRNGGSGTVTISLGTTNDGPQEPGGTASVGSYRDTNCALNTHYEYYLTGFSWGWVWQPAAGSTPGQWNSTLTPTGVGPSAYVTVVKKSVSANQTVDTRIDPRFDVPPLKNYPFVDTQFRGGLFAGYNADSAQVARTYLKFSSLPGPSVSGETLWPIGGMAAFATRNAKTGTASILCHAAASSAWDPATLTWGNAPALTSGKGGSASVPWNRTNPLEQWVLFDVNADIAAAIGSDLTLVLMATSESGSGATTTASPGWAYFARNTYAEPAAPTGGTPPPAPPTNTLFNPGDMHGQDLSAYLLYAFGGSATDAVHFIQVSPNPVYGSGSATGTVNLPLGMPSTDLVLSLSSDDPSVSVPATVTIPAHSSSATFSVSVTGTSSTTSRTVTVRARNSDYDLSGTLVVAPSP